MMSNDTSIPASNTAILRSAQRLPASEITTLEDREILECLWNVLNAFRHLMITTPRFSTSLCRPVGSAQRLPASEITTLDCGRGIPAIRRDVLNGTEATTRLPARCAQRLPASEITTPGGGHGRFHRYRVLNAFRHLR